MYPTRQPTTPRPCDFNLTTSSCVSLLLKYPPLRPLQPRTSCSHLFVQLRLLCTRTCMSSVLTVAAKFHGPALNSTSVALCYLSVISHVHFWLTKQRRKCVCVCVIVTLCKVKQKCEKWRWEKRDVSSAAYVVKFVIDATFEAQASGERQICTLGGSAASRL